MTTLQSLVIIDIAKEEMLGFHFGTWPHVMTLLRGLVSSWLTSWVPLITSHYLAKFGRHRSSRKGDILFLICSRDHVVMWCYGWILLILVIATQVLGHFLVENTWLTCNNMCWPVTCESWASTSVRKYKTNTFDESVKFLHWLFLVTSDGFRSFLVVLSWFKLF